jgi:hypothetical protein
LSAHHISCITFDPKPAIVTKQLAPPLICNKM